MAKVIVWEDGQKVIREYDPAIDAPVEPTPAELEAEVQRVADDLTANNERDVAIALATIDLVLAARDGQLADMTKADIVPIFRRRVEAALRNRRGI